MTMICSDCNRGYKSTFWAAWNGHPKCLEYAHKKGCPWHPNTTWGAAQNGHLNCLEYAHKNGCLLHPQTTYWAARNGHINCLEYAHKNGCPLHPCIMNIAYIYRYSYAKYIYYNCDLDKIDTNLEKFVKEKKVIWYTLINIAKSERYYLPADIWNMIKKYW